MEALRHQLAEQTAKLENFKALFASKEAECAELTKKSQTLFERLAEKGNAFIVKSELYDEVVKKSGAGQLKPEHKRTARKNA